MTRRNAPHRPPGRRDVPEGVPLRGRREKGPKRAPSPRTPREPEDYLIYRGASRYEDAAFLQRLAEQTAVTAEEWGEPVLFGVSGWISTARGREGVGYARVSEIESLGFRVIYTPNLGGGRPGHVTIVLRDPVDDDQAALLNEAFGREP